MLCKLNNIWTKKLIKWVVVLGVAFILYTFSWLLCIGKVREGSVFLSSNKVFIYDYEYHCIEISRKLDLSDESYVKLTKTVHLFFLPLEEIGTCFKFYFIKRFCGNNLKTLTNFNSYSDDKKKSFLEFLVKYKNGVLDLDEEEMYSLYKISNNAASETNVYFPCYDLFDLGISITTKIEFYNYSHLNVASIYYDFDEYNEFFFELKKFSNWYNKINITSDNPNFNKEFLENYWKYIKEKDEKEIVR